MSSKKEEKSQDAADRIKAAALNAAKGLSRAQAERAAAAAARNVNAYGQKEEGPSRWQERKEAKRQMYLMSTEKAVKLGERKDLKSSFSGGSAQCQKCFQTGHWTYACKNERVYISRPSRTQQLKNPKLKMKFSDSYELDNPENPLVGNRGEDEPSGSGRKKLDKGRGKGKKTKRKHSDSESESDASEASVFSSDSESSDEGSSGTDSDNSSDETNSRGSSSESESEDERIRRKKRKQKKRRHHKHRRSSAFSDSESDYDSDSDEGSRKKSRRHSKRR